MNTLKMIFMFLCILITTSYIQAEENKDERTLVILPDNVKETMFILMGDHIRALENIIQAVQAEEYDKAERIVESQLSWSSSKRPEDQNVIKHWPEPMQKMADQLYHAASNYIDISQNAAIHENMGSNHDILLALGEVITTCRSCHETYRIR